MEVLSPKIMKVNVSGVWKMEIGTEMGVERFAKSENNESRCFRCLEKENGYPLAQNRQECMS